jgi:hypothetical protein
MFTYTDAEPERPDFEKLLDAYFHLLPAYQGMPLEALKFKCAPGGRAAGRRRWAKGPGDPCIH